MNYPTSHRRGAGGKLPPVVLAAIIVGSAVSGFAAAALVITHGAASGSGTRTAGVLLSYWTQTNSTLGNIPATAPATASTTVASPTRLASAAEGYSLNTATAGHNATDWWFTETSSAPINTELELNVILTTGASPGTQTSFKVYFETQATAPGATIVFEIYYDSGTTGVAFDWSETWTDQCSAVGTCP
jgi:hypothetical protein